MNRKYLLLSLAPIAVIVSFPIIGYYSDPCNFHFCFDAEFWTEHAQYVKDMEYVSEQVGSYVSSIEAGTVYSDHNGDLEQIIEHLKKQRADGKNMEYIQKITNATHTEVWHVYNETYGDVEETIRILNNSIGHNP